MTEAWDDPDEELRELFRIHGWRLDPAQWLGTYPRGNLWPAEKGTPPRLLGYTWERLEGLHASYLRPA